MDDMPCRTIFEEPAEFSHKIRIFNHDCAFAPGIEARRGQSDTSNRTDIVIDEQHPSMRNHTSDNTTAEDRDVHTAFPSRVEQFENGGIGHAVIHYENARLRALK